MLHWTQNQDLLIQQLKNKTKQKRKAECKISCLVNNLGLTLLKYD